MLIHDRCDSKVESFQYVTVDKRVKITRKYDNRIFLGQLWLWQNHLFNLTFDLFPYSIEKLN